MTALPRPHTPGVKPRHGVPEALLRLAALQAGLVTREQVLGHGLSRHVLQWLLDTGAWQPVARGLFVTGTVSPSWDGLAWGGLLLGGDRARLGPQASAYLHELVADAPSPIDVLVPLGRVVRIPGPWQFRRETPGIRSPRVVGAPARLTVEDTLLDLCATAQEHHVVSLLTTAVSSRRTTAARILRRMGERNRQPRRRLLRELLGDVAQGAESPIEHRYLNDVERPHGLPVGDRQESRLGVPYCSVVGYNEYQLLVVL